MINIKDKHNCCGCEACVQACPKQCISFEEDTEGFRYPKVDESLCVDCGVCERTCPVLTPFESRIPQKQFAAINPDETIRKQSSSGGIFTMLAEKVIDEGGIVFGVRFDKNWQAVFDYTETVKGLADFRGSKYVQARVGIVFRQVREFLKQDRKVLFTGTPCQVSALRHFLHHEYENLLLVDFICHGVPSPKVWRLYLDEVTKNAVRAISDVWFRNKKQGWKRFNFDLAYDKDGQSYSISSWWQENHYMRAFLSDVILRPSCYDCKAKSGRSGSDLTIADFWGIGQLNPKMDDDLGTSLVMVHTEIGLTCLNSLQLNSWEAKYEDVLQLNPSVDRSAQEHFKRKWFFSRLDVANSIISLINSALRIPLYLQIKHFFKSLLYWAWSILRGRHNVSNNMCCGNFKTCEIRYPIISDFTFRSKYYGWKKYRMRLKLKDKM